MMDFTQVYKKYKGLWVALSADENKVVGKGKTVKAAIAQARRRGITTPYLFKVPNRLISYVSSGA
jgi:hypothetical protein